MIFCSYYGNVKNIMRNTGRTEKDFLGISVRSVRDFDITGVPLVYPDYEKVVNLKTGVISWKEYCLDYYEKLYKIPDEKWKIFLEGCNEKILLCYEKDVKTCHRYLLGKFLFWKFEKCKMVEVDCNLKFWKIEKKLIKV